MYFRRFPRTQHTLCEDVQDAVYVLNRKKTIVLKRKMIIIKKKEIV